MQTQHRSFLMWMTFFLAGWLFFSFYKQTQISEVKSFNYPKFLQALKKDYVKKDSIVFHLTSKEISGELNAKGEKALSGKVFSIEGNVEDKGFEILRQYGITPSYSNKDKSFWVSLLVNWLPILLIVFLFIFFIRSLQMGGNRAFSFGKNRARLVPDKSKAAFKDVAGVEEAKEELKELVAFLKNPKKFTRLGGEIPKGVLLIGAPGTGKTLLARAVAGEAKVPFFTISGSDFVEMFVGVGASRVRDLFKEASKNKPCLVFIDEIDAVGRHRGAGLGGGHDEREQTLNQLLVEMDGFESNEGIILIAATNRPDVLDPALLRPGRFDRRVMVDLPDLNGRTEILKVHTRKTPLAKNIDLKTISRGTPGFSGADLKNLINEASLRAAFKNKKEIEMEDLDKARDKVIMGSERKSFIMSDEDKKITAYHEAGHALVGCKLPLLDPIHKVTIVPRGMALGVTQTLPKEDRLNMSKNRARNTLVFLLGGRAAEFNVFTDYTSGASNDIEKATELAHRMICEWGMSEKLGPRAFGKNSQPVFVGKGSPAENRDYSESSAKLVDEEIETLIQDAYAKAKDIITTYRKELDTMAEALLHFETIFDKEVQFIMQGKTLKELKSLREQEASLKVSQSTKAGVKKPPTDDSVGSPAPAPAS